MVEAQGFLMKVYVIPENIQGVPSLKLTVRTQKYAIPKGNWYSNHPFSGAMLVFGGVTCKEKKVSNFLSLFLVQLGQNRPIIPLRSHTFRTLRFRRVLLGIHQIIIYAHLIMRVFPKTSSH